jgi:transcriptional regulator with XRE-family HTH domain
MAHTKLSKLLILRGMTQQELYNLVKLRTGQEIQLYRISNMVNGKLKNYKVSTARILAQALQVPTDAIIEEGFEN